MLIVLTGKTASGKDTIKSALLSKYPNLKKVITTTSRTPRQGEKEDVDYHFLTRDEFQSKVASGEFAEHVEYGGNLYGTYKKELDQTLNSDLLWRIDPSRAGHVRELLDQAYPGQKVVVIYITVSDEVVLQRLKNRGLSEEEIQSRMVDDKNIWEEYKEEYDFVVDNTPGKLSDTINKVVSIIDEN